MKKLLKIVIIVFSIVLVWNYAGSIQAFFQKFFLTKINPAEISRQIQNIEKRISAPPPLKGSLEEKPSQLSISGVIKWTNINRAQNGSLPALKENSKLDAAAKAKMNDMFKQQYFEHENPQGKGPADLAKAAGYDYISIGENLALGNFKDDEELVTAWMNSPGHRANILNKGFIEIGVAVGKGNFEGKQVWLAVQEFGKPASACPSIDSSLKLQIDVLESEASNLEPQLKELKAEIDQASPKNKAEYDAYNEKVKQYNALVAIYNNKVDQAKALVTQYNAQVRAFNACAGN